MGKMSKATLEAKLLEAEAFNKILLKENKELKDKIKKLQNTRTAAGRKPFKNEIIIKEMFILYYDGFSLQQIADSFNSRGIKTARGVSGAKAALVGL